MLGTSGRSVNDTADSFGSVLQIIESGHLVVESGGASA